MNSMFPKSSLTWAEILGQDFLSEVTRGGRYGPTASGIGAAHVDPMLNRKTVPFDNIRITVEASKETGLTDYGCNAREGEHCDVRCAVKGKRRGWRLQVQAPHYMQIPHCYPRIANNCGQGGSKLMDVTLTIIHELWSTIT